jgi:predicted transcriptional regulator
MPRPALLMSIRPTYAAQIFDGTKTVELRRVRPRLTSGDLVLVYASSPVKALLGAFEVSRVIVAAPSKLWNRVGRKAGTTREQFNDYFDGAALGYGIVLKRTWQLAKPMGLEKLRQRHSNFRPPQSYHYLTAKQANRIGLVRLIGNGASNGHRNGATNGKVRPRLERLPGKHSEPYTGLPGLDQLQPPNKRRR